MNVLNFALIALDVAVVEGSASSTASARLLRRSLPVEFASGLLTAGIAYAYQGKNLSAVALVAVIGLVFQYLLRTALNSMDRKDQLEGRTRSSPRCRSGSSARSCRRSPCATR